MALVCMCVSYWSCGKQVAQQPQSLHEHVGVRVREETEELFCSQRSHDLHFDLLISLESHVLKHTHTLYISTQSLQRLTVRWH